MQFDYTLFLNSEFSIGKFSLRNKIWFLLDNVFMIYLALKLLLRANASEESNIILNWQIS